MFRYTKEGDSFTENNLCEVVRDVVGQAVQVESKLTHSLKPPGLIP